MTTNTDADLRSSIRAAARAMDQAISDAANLADRQPVNFAVGDALAEAHRQLRLALYEL